MSALFHDKHTDTFLIGIGTTLYLYANKSIKKLSKCGQLPETTDEKKDVKKTENIPAYITGIATSKNYVAVINNNKALELFDRTNSRCACVKALKRPTSVQLTDSNVILSDKSGDVYSYSLPELSNQPTYLLGHVSVIMDSVITPDNRYLITCDRDEKIRISHYPNCYNIHSYMLGHTEYVYKILQLTHNTILSMGGDSTLIHWDMRTSSPLQTLPSNHGNYTAFAFYSPYLVAASSTHITVHRLQTPAESDKDMSDVSDKDMSDMSLVHVSELSLSESVLSLAVSSGEVLVLTSKPELLSYELIQGVMCNKSHVSGGDVDLAELVPTALPEKKSVDTSGFKDYFERKKRRIEEETLKEMKVS